MKSISWLDTARARACKVSLMPDRRKPRSPQPTTTIFDEVSEARRVTSPFSRLLRRWLPPATDNACGLQLWSWSLPRAQAHRLRRDKVDSGQIHGVTSQSRCPIGIQWKSKGRSPPVSGRSTVQAYSPRSASARRLGRHGSPRKRRNNPRLRAA